MRSKITARRAARSSWSWGINPTTPSPGRASSCAARSSTRSICRRVLREPTTSRLVLEKLARKVATGASVDENDGGFLVMPKALVEQRPDIVRGWLEAELDAQLYFADEKNADDVSRMALEQTTGFTQKVLWFSAYGRYPDAEGGTATRISLPYTFTTEA